MKIGTTSYGFRYLLAGPTNEGSLPSLVEQAAAARLDRLQVCENARPLELSDAAWREARDTAQACGIELTLGCMTLRLATLERYMRLAANLGTPNLRIVLEEEGGGRPEPASVREFLDAAQPLLESYHTRLVIENHFHLSCRLLADFTRDYPANRVAFCIDTANSLRNFESAEAVMECLGARAVMYHLKDYRVCGSNVGFRVEGAPLGRGDLDVRGFLGRVLARDAAPEIYLENWVPPSGDRQRDIEQDALWLRQSLEYFEGIVA